MYTATGECSTQEPEENGHFSVQDNIYTCRGDYPFLDLTGEKPKCVEACTDTSYVYNEGDAKICLTATQCATHNGYTFENGSMVCITATECTRTPDHLTYNSDDGNTGLCIAKSRCPELGYELRIQCLT